MPRVLGDDSDPRAASALPRFVIAYAVICIVAAVFIIGSVLLTG
jgi:hypothetical protein